MSKHDMDVGDRVQHVNGRDDLHGIITALTEDAFGNPWYVVDLDNEIDGVRYNANMMEPETPVFDASERAGWILAYAGEARERFLSAVMQSRGETVEVVRSDGFNFTGTLVAQTDVENVKLAVRRWLDEEGKNTTMEYVPLFSEDEPHLRSLYVY